MGRKKNTSEKVSKKNFQPNPWGQFRSPSAAWAKLERRGDSAIVLGGPSNHTATEMRHDYDLLYWAVRQLNQWVSQERENGKQPTLEKAKQVFGGTILVGGPDRVPYLTDEELGEQIAHQQAPSALAERVVSLRWGFTEATGATYIRRKPTSRKSQNGRNQ